MNLREPGLPPGWYPSDADVIGEFLGPFEKVRATSTSGLFASALAAIAPHAGWHFSGQLAALAIAALIPNVETVVVIGGHLSRGMPVLTAAEDAVKTPLGNIMIDRELRQGFQKHVDLLPDRYTDNTVETLLPMVRYFFPKSKLLWLRFPALISSYEAGKLLAFSAGHLNRSIAVIASTDLTHYGDNFGFSPKGRGKAALEWVKNINDASFIRAVLKRDPHHVLWHAEKDRSSCSVGAVLGALGFASARDKKPKLLEYHTSADVSKEENPSSFVGYAAFSMV